MEVLTENDVYSDDNYHPDAVLSEKLRCVVEELIGTIEEKEEFAPYGVNCADPIEMAKLHGYEGGLREARGIVMQFLGVILQYKHEVER